MHQNKPNRVSEMNQSVKLNNKPK